MAYEKEEIIELRRRVLEKDFSRMNQRQQEAVFWTDGPLLILAGAGSGKTTVLVNRIANLVRYGKAYNNAFVQPEFSEEDAAACQDYLRGGQLSEITRARLSVSACRTWKIMAITFTNKASGEMK